MSFNKLTQQDITRAEMGILAILNAREKLDGVPPSLLYQNLKANKIVPNLIGIKIPGDSFMKIINPYRSDRSAFDTAFNFLQEREYISASLSHSRSYTITDTGKTYLHHLLTVSPGNTDLISPFISR